MIRHFLIDTDLSYKEQKDIFSLAKKIKKNKFKYRPYEGPQTVALIFDNPSTRTRVSFSVAISQLGGNPLQINKKETQMSRRENIIDTINTLSQFVSTVVWRTNYQNHLEEMALNSDVPIINALSNNYHPCQVLADILTIKEYKGYTSGLTFSYFGDGSNNMANSYILGGITSGMHIRIASPKTHQPSKEIIEKAREISKITLGSLTISEDPEFIAKDSDILATDTWISMNYKKFFYSKSKLIKIFKPYQINSYILSLAKKTAIVLHCLPAYRGYEITKEVIDGKQSVIWQETQNKLHVQKALMVWLMKQNAKFM